MNIKKKCLLLYSVFDLIVISDNHIFQQVNIPFNHY